MKRKFLAAFFLALIPLSAEAQDYSQALEDFRPKLNPQAFSEARLSYQNQLVLEATDEFLARATSGQKGWVWEALLAWSSSLNAAGINDNSPLAEVVRPGGGSLWRLSEGKVRQLEEWSDDKLSLGSAERRGRLFGFFGGQLSNGGTANATGLNARIGSTLFKNRYDLALTFGYNSADTTPKSTIVSYGLVGRALFPLTRRIGWNIGAQAVRSDPNLGNATNTVSALGGINFYLPKGSFDLTLTYGSRGSLGLLIGYTLYLTKS